MAQRQALRLLLGLSPNNRITGGKVISSKTEPSASRAAAALRLAANALHRSDSALGAVGRRLSWVRQGHHRTAHKLRMLRDGQEYVDAGAEYYEKQYQDRALRAAKRRAAHWAISWCLSPMLQLRACTTDQRPRQLDSFS